MQQFTIEKNEAGQRLDKFLHKYLKEASSGFLYKMLRRKNITLNEKKADGKEQLKEGDCICFFFSEETFNKFRGMPKKKSKTDDPMKTNSDSAIKGEYGHAFSQLKGIQVIYEDEHILLVNKPAGILSQKADRHEPSLNEWLIGYLLDRGSIQPKQLETFKPAVCNRLDRNTSGLVICGKSLSGSQKMSELLRERTVHKFYRTFVRGEIREGCHVKGYLAKDERFNKVLFRDQPEDGRKDFEAVETRYFPLDCYGKMTYLEVELITGKPHQIRAHLSHLGHPILGDAKYGDLNFNTHLSGFNPKWQLLHAYRLEFPSLEAPFEQLSGKIFIAPEPEYFSRIKKTAERN
ncbi:MAG: RluA family pseudouridine synthase [Lachnospiraceae bacterium]|nr:RluA family pseudouridine synthase [Lachnospiraceae bacterium]